MKRARGGCARRSRRNSRRATTTGLELPDAEIARINAYFAAPPLSAREPVSARVQRRRGKDAKFADFVQSNVAPHKVPGYAVVTVSLKPIGGVPGDASADQMDAVADLAEDYSSDELRVSHEQNLILPHVALDDLSGGLRPARLGRPRRRPMRASSATSSPAPASIIARSRPRARSRSRSGSPSASATACAHATSGRSRSKSPAASTPAAIIMSAISAFSASSAPARRPIRSRSAARATRPPRSVRSPAPASATRRSSTPSRPWSRPT